MSFKLSKNAMSALSALSGDCIGCSLCQRHCLFLQKYGINLRELSMRPELLYGCFLCDRCLSDCPKDISGKEIALSGRAALRHEQGGTPKGSAGLLWEKDPYRFANYKRANRTGGDSASALWTGCNFTAFFPNTDRRLRALFSAHGIGVIHDCCGKPVSELGLSADAEWNMEEIIRKLREQRITELVMVCPNCYYYMKPLLPKEIRLVTVYRKLQELGLGRKLSKEALPLYLPCPDRKERIFREDLRAFLPEDAEETSYADLQCCGLGGCAFLQEGELSAEMSRQAVRLSESAAAGKALYTYCASCVSRFQRQGLSGARHLLPLILGTEEALPGGVRPFLFRAAQALPF